MILTIDRFQKAKEKFINDGFMKFDDTEESQKWKLACLSLAETFIENWFMSYENADVDEEEFLDFAKTQIAVLITGGVNQKLDKEVIKTGNVILSAFICVVYEMYFEEKVAGTC